MTPEREEIMELLKNFRISEIVTKGVAAIPHVIAALESERIWIRNSALFALKSGLVTKVEIHEALDPLLKCFVETQFESEVLYILEMVKIREFDPKLFLKLIIALNTDESKLYIDRWNSIRDITGNHLETLALELNSEDSKVREAAIKKLLELVSLLCVELTKNLPKYTLPTGLLYICKLNKAIGGILYSVLIHPRAEELDEDLRINAYFKVLNYVDNTSHKDIITEKLAKIGNAVIPYLVKIFETDPNQPYQERDCVEVRLNFLIEISKRISVPDILPIILNFLKNKVPENWKEQKIHTLMKNISLPDITVILPFLNNTNCLEYIRDFISGVNESNEKRAYLLFIPDVADERTILSVVKDLELAQLRKLTREFLDIIKERRPDMLEAIKKRASDVYKIAAKNKSEGKISINLDVASFIRSPKTDRPVQFRTAKRRLGR